MSWIYSVFTLLIFLLSIMNCYRLYYFVIAYSQVFNPHILRTDSADGSVSNLFSYVLDADGKNKE